MKPAEPRAQSPACSRCSARVNTSSLLLPVGRWGAVWGGVSWRGRPVCACLGCGREQSGQCWGSSVPLKAPPLQGVGRPLAPPGPLARCPGAFPALMGCFSPPLEWPKERSLALTDQGCLSAHLEQLLT